MRGSHPNRKRRPVMNRFTEKFIPEPMSGCWLWIGAIKRDPRYRTNDRPLFHVGSRVTKRLRPASHVAWELYHHPMPADMCVLHTCDNPMCVNPDHLFLGTRIDNVRDMDAKGRRRNGPRLGERNHAAKITADIVQNIRQSVEKGAVLAKRYGLSSSTITNIRHRQSWSHIP